MLVGGVGEINDTNVNQLVKVKVVVLVVVAVLLMVSSSSSAARGTTTIGIFGLLHAAAAAAAAAAGVALVDEQQRAGVEAECVQLGDHRPKCLQPPNEPLQQAVRHKVLRGDELAQRGAKALRRQLPPVVLVVADEAVEALVVDLLIWDRKLSRWTRHKRERETVKRQDWGHREKRALEKKLYLNAGDAQAKRPRGGLVDLRLVALLLRLRRIVVVQTGAHLQVDNAGILKVGHQVFQHYES